MLRRATAWEGGRKPGELADENETCRLTLTIPGVCGPEGGDSERGDRRHALLLDPTSLTSRVECVHLFVRSEPPGPDTRLS